MIKPPAYSRSWLPFVFALLAFTFAIAPTAPGATGVGAVTLIATGSNLDFEARTIGTPTFASFSPANHALTINNWTATPGVADSVMTDRLTFAANQSANLTSFSFTGDASGAMEIPLGGDYYEMVPTTPVPEPSTYVAGALALAAFIYHQRRRLRPFARTLT